MTRSPSLLLLLALSGCTSAFLLPPPLGLPLEQVGVVALAGPDLVVLEGSRAALAARASRSFAGDPLLSWSQVDGPAVLLTNPSSPLPAFVAPLGPARLRFELRAEAAGAVATDEIVVDVVSVVPTGGVGLGPAGFIDAPGDTVAEPLSTHTFRVVVRGVTGPDGAPAPSTVTARVNCGDGAATTVSAVDIDDSDVTVVLPATLPCAVVIDGVDDAGRGLAPAARIFWPAATPIPAATSVSAAITLVESGGEASLVFDDENGGRAWSVGGTDDVLPGGDEGARIDFTVPRRAGRLVLAAEAVASERSVAEGLAAGPSGGVEYEVINVSAGSGNLAPVARGGPDRVVQPGARFRLDTSGSFDLDGDGITVSTEQVLGPSAIGDALIGGAFQAPEEAGVLLFHVVADDGRVLSAADSVRVVVDTDAENLPPVLALAATRYAIPGETFLVDGSGAEDPDSGFIETITIAQSVEDAVILLAEPVDAESVALVAGEAGDVYRFLISAYDEDGLGVTVEQTVIVEEAGPYVDALRGSDVDGNGTAAAPFASVAGALATAVRHALPELLLADGLHSPLGVVLPPLVSLRGGFVFEDGAYVTGGDTTLPVGGEGLGFVDGHAADLTLALTSAEGSIALQGSASLEGVRVVDTTDHTAPLVIVRSLGAARIGDVDVEPSGAPFPATVVVEADATARFLDARVAGALGADAVAISCVGATVALELSNIVGAAGADVGTGVRAREGCAVDVTASIVSGGETLDGTGIDAEATLLTTDTDSTITGAFGDAINAVAVRVAGRERSALIKSTLLATADTATGLLCDDAQVNLVGAAIEAHGASAVAVQPDRCALASQNAVLLGETAGLRGALADDVIVTGGSIDGGESAVDLDGSAARSFRDVVVRASGIGVRARDAFVELENVDIAVEGDGDVLALGARGASVIGSVLSSAGGSAVTLGELASSIERTVIHSTRSASATLTHAGDLSVSSSFVTNDAVGGIESIGILTLRHATVVTPGAALTMLAGATLDAANSVLSGEPAIASASTGAPWQQAVALALSSTGTLVTQPGVLLATVAQLDDAGCDRCLVIDASLVVDAEGHLTAGDNPLVDAGDNDLSLANDIDGDVRPQGNGVDIGCDERAP